MNSKFLNNSASEVGALKLNVNKAVVTQALFEENHATEGDGGGITAVCDDKPCNYVLSFISFTRNTAKIKGGAICWTSVQPTLDTNLFWENTAEYGGDIASFGASLALMNIEESTGTEAKVSKEGGVELTNVASGQRVPFVFYFGIVDHYNKLITTDNSSSCDLLPLDTVGTAVTGETRVIAVKGLYEFSDVVITSKPGTSVGLKASSAAIDLNTVESSIIVPIQLRLCLPGESNVGNTCVVCAPGTYSLDPNNPCDSCPSGAICYGGNLIVPQAGYWRSSRDSDKFIECLFSYACLGSPFVVPYPIGACAEGYHGNLCQPCENGFSRSGDNKCSKCLSRSSTIPRFIGLVLSLGLICAILVRTTLKTAHQPESLHSIYLKIFTSYLQLVLITSTLDLDWPKFVKYFFNKQNYTNSAVGQNLFSFECFLAGDEPEEDSYIQVYFDRLLILAGFPVGVALAVCIFWFIVYFYTHKQNYLRKEMFVTIVVLFFLNHPSLIREYFSVFSCRRLDDDTLWLNANLDIKCFEGLHFQYALTVALPSIIIWGVGVPSIILGYLVRKREVLNDIKLRCRFGFFYNGFRSSYFYWEFLILYRKIIIVSLLVFLGNESIAVQALTMLILLLVFFLLQYWKSPYKNDALNRMELKAIFVAGVTIYCGLYYLTKDINEYLKVFLFVLILLANTYFLYFFVVSFGKVILSMLGSRFKLFKRFRPKIDNFPLVDITTTSSISSHTYLNEDRSRRSTLISRVEETYNLPFSEEIENLPELLLYADPHNTYNVDKEDNEDKVILSSARTVISEDSIGDLSYIKYQ